MLLTPVSAMRDVKLLADDLDRPGDAGLAAGAEAVNIGAADQAGLGAERQRPHHVLAGADAAVEQDLDLASPPHRRCAGNIEIEDGAPSSWRPPWLETTIAAAPVPAAALASSTSRMPLMISLPGQMLRIHSMSFQFSASSNCVRGPFGQRLDVLHAFHMAGQVAEGPALARQHAVDPAAVWSPC